MCFSGFHTLANSGSNYNWNAYKREAWISLSKVVEKQWSVVTYLKVWELFIHGVKLRGHCTSQWNRITWSRYEEVGVLPLFVSWSISDLSLQGCFYLWYWYLFIFYIYDSLIFVTKKIYISWDWYIHQFLLQQKRQNKLTIKVLQVIEKALAKRVTLSLPLKWPLNYLLPVCPSVPWT